MSVLGKLFSNSQAGNDGSVVGIDIGSSAIKVVELQDRSGVITLTTYGELQLGPYMDKSVGEPVNLERNKEQEVLVDVIRESAVTAKDAVFAMPLSSSFVTNVDLEAGSDADLSSLVRVEARKVIPASLSEITLDWAEVEAGPEDTEAGIRKVLIAAIQNSALDRFKVLMKFAGLNQPPTEIECFSTARALYDSTEDNLAIIDIGATSTKLYITQKGLLMRMHRVRAGGSLATQRIAEQEEISFEQAELLKQTIKRKDGTFGNVQKAHHSTYERAFREFNQVIREYEKENEVALDAVYLAGGGALFPGIKTLLKESLQKEVLHANPFKKVAYPAFMQDTMLEIGPAFTAALGAALRVYE
jgi:type IV pilus assembly protein PilM